MLAAGSLRYSIMVAAASTTQSGTGQITTTYTPMLQTRAAIKAITSKEVYALGAGFTSQVTHKVSIRYPAVNVTAGMQVEYGARTFLVQAVSDPDELKIQLDLLCLEQTR